MRNRLCFRVLRGLGSLLVLAVIAVGCGTGGPVIGSVSGLVTHGGEPVSPGLVNLVSKTGFAVSVKLDRNGVYTARSQHGNGVPLGTYRVSVTDVPLTDQEVVAALRGGSVTVAPPTDLVKIPPKYREFGTSGLTIEVQEGVNVFDIELDPKSKPGI